jgi:hypothetical protein
MTTTAAKTENKTFAEPDETRTFERGQVDLVDIAGTQIGRLTIRAGPGPTVWEQIMTITTRIHRQPVRTSMAFATATAVLLGAPACGTEHAADRAPGSLGQATAPSPSAEVPPDVAECLREQAKAKGATLRCWELTQPDDGEPSVLAPTGRPIPLPGSNG